MTHCRNTHDTLQKYSWHITEITNNYVYITQGMIEDLPSINARVIV